MQPDDEHDMLNIIKFTVVAAITALTGCVQKDLQELPECKTGVDPIAVTPPSHPPATDRHFRGTIVVRTEISADGNVADVKIVSSELANASRGQREPDGYDDAVLAAIKSWKYPKQGSDCFKYVTVKLD
mgnify:CR=1 FL=1